MHALGRHDAQQAGAADRPRSAAGTSTRDDARNGAPANLRRRLLRSAHGPRRSFQKFYAAQSARVRDSDRKARQEADADSSGTPRRRTDVRLALPAALVWAASVAGLWLPPLALAGVCCALLVLAALLLRRTFKARTSRRAPRGHGKPARRSFLTTMAVALLLAATAAAHSAVAATQRHDGPLAAAVSAGKSVVAVLEVAGTPRALTAPNQAGPPARWSVPVWTRDISTGGVVLRTRAQLVVMGGGGWGTVVPGEMVRATGKLRPADPGKEEAGILTASSGPGQPFAPPILQGAAKELRERFVSAASFLAPDPRGLLPGMVTGDTSALDEGLNSAMKSVGMTHLTAVSGANCSLVLGALLLLARRFRLSRLPAAALAVAGLGLFVLLVGPDASVLRAAVMGAVAVAALAAGRSGRGLSFLCLAVIGLLLVDPGLGSSFGFLLSVLATLGIIILGQRMMSWTPPFVPRWAAAAVAVPLSAQLLCGPVIVVLQPQFSTYSLLANVIASPLVAPVTLLGTAAVPLVVLAPWVATGLIAVAGTFSAGVAGTARFTSQLPGAALPWPEGVPGLLTMVFLSVLTFLTVWAAVRPRRLVRFVMAVHSRIVSLIEVLERYAAGRLESYSRKPRRMPAPRFPARCFPSRRVLPKRGPGLDRAAGRGRLGYSTKLSGRKP
ncbi:ComEC/Rec2 family competence protein [Pseudarthrobacter sp. R1]|uniref:ComEC/Rec2 family competence protein n=1 Tax=Pseudarthrobacter sp. R1 TaxID=2944934 RepID=UPI00210B98EA|nr:ComEC/Rec2 family competence protein [Pseudarthrobacter sp. R1]MCQ6272832.1 ComEC/Rec2 family competence protein [Pseudarthrobacter sp. R1]